MRILKYCLALAIAPIISACESSNSNYNIVEVELNDLHGDVAIQVADEEPKVFSWGYLRGNLTLATRANELTQESIQITSQPDNQFCMVDPEKTDLSEFPARLVVSCIPFSEVPEGVSEVAVSTGSTCAIIHDHLHCWGRNYNEEWHHGIEYSSPRLLVKPKSNVTRSNAATHCLIDDFGLHCHGSTRLDFDTELLWEQFDGVRELALNNEGTELCFIDNNGLQCAGPDSGGLADVLDESARELISPYSLTIAGNQVCVADEGKPLCWGGLEHPPEDLTDVQSIKTSVWGGCAHGTDTLHCWGMQEIAVPRSAGLIADFAIRGLWDVCALTLNGTQCWGVDSGVNRWIAAIENLNYPDSLVMSNSHGCVITEGRLSCFDRNRSSDLMPIIP